MGYPISIYHISIWHVPTHWICSQGLAFLSWHLPRMRMWFTGRKTSSPMWKRCLSEVSTFHTLSDHCIDFIENWSEIISSTFSPVMLLFFGLFHQLYPPLDGNQPHEKFPHRGRRWRSSESKSHRTEPPVVSQTHPLGEKHRKKYYSDYILWVWDTWI